MSSECDALRAELNRIRQEIAALDSRFIPVSERPNIYGGIREADGKATDALSKIVTLITALANLAAQIVAARTVADGADSKASRALGLLQVVQTAIAFILGELRQFVLRERFNALENRVSIIEAGLDILTRLANTLANRIAQNLAKIEALTQRVNALEILVRSFAGLIAALTARVDALASELAQIKARLSTAENQIRINTAAIAVLTAGLAALTVIVNGLVAAVAIIQGQITVLFATLTALTKAVALLTAKVVALQTQVAIILRRLIALEFKVNKAIQLATDALTLARLARTIANQALDRANQAYELARRAYGVAIRALDQAFIATRNAAAAKQVADTALELANTAILITQAIRRDIAAILNRLGRIDIDIRSIYVRVNTLEDLITVIQEKLDEIISLLSGSADSAIELLPCEVVEDVDYSLPYAGNGLAGLYSGLNVLAQAVETINDNTRCKPDRASLALPMHFETRAGEVPQLVILWGPVDTSAPGAASRWSMSVPHPRSDIGPDTPFNFPNYQKGSWQLTYKLRDNSKIILNADSRADALNVLAYLKTLVSSGFIDPDIEPTITENAGQGRLKVVLVRATYIQFFTGHRTQVAEWSKALPQ